jgi:asparagine synthase (glutamine-hydrolysing)
MANSVEGRYPFLDHRLIEFSTRLQESLKLNGLNEKYLLKKMIGEKIPESICKRTKQAYRAPMSNCFFGESTIDYVESILDDATINEYGIFNAGLTSKLVNKIKTTGTASEMENMILIGIISTQLFYQFFILGKPPVFNKTNYKNIRIIEEN